MTNEQLRMQMLSGIITEGEYKAKLEEKSSLNESMIGGIVGVGAINQIPSREKTDYEMAFEHFLGERYETKFENREQDLEEAEYRPNLVPNPEVSKEEYLENIAYWTAQAQDLEKFKAQLEGRLKRAKNPIVIEDLEGEIDFVQQQIDLYYSMVKDRQKVMRKIKEGKEVEEPSLYEDEKPTYNDFVQMVRDDMMAGAAPDERPSDEKVRERAKVYYNEYLQGTSVDDLFESESKEEVYEDEKPGTAKERSMMAKKARAGKDIGEKGKNFEKIAKSAAKKYGSKEAGEKVAGAVMYGKLNK